MLKKKCLITTKKKGRNDLKEKGTCPDCGMEMTQHSLRYTHKKYCKAKQISIETVENKTLDKIEEEKVETPPPSPPNFKGQYLVLQMLCRWYKSQLMIK